MEKHILNLLNTNLRVIIPDFGAFIIRQKEPLVLVFNEFLRYNDGLLIDYIAKNENIDKDMAKHQVAEFTENLVKVLESGKEVKLEGIGTLRKSSDDKIEFVQAGKETPKRSTKKVQEKKQDEAAMDTTVPLEILPEETGATSRPVSDSKTKTGKNGDTQPAKAETRPETIKSTKDEPAKADIKAHEKRPVSNGSAKKTTEQPKPDLKPKDIEKPPVKQNIARTPVAKTPLTREKSNKKQQMGWIILIVIVVALINAWFIFNDPIKNFFSTHKLSKPVPDTLGQVVEVDTETATAAVAADTAAKFKEVLEDDFYVGGETAEKAPDVVTAKSAVPGEKRYYIVAGCFRDEINARAMVKELNQKGYKAEKFGTIGNLHAVSYSSFTNKEKAQKELERIRKEVAPEAWMVYY
jgi:nucleoid DNA-binding protein